MQTITASMVNAVLYCERLLYLRSKAGEEADNYYLADGRAVHRRADDGARSIEVYSERLDLSAKPDAVEGEGGAVDVVEYKRGSAPDVPEEAHLPERAQLCAQVLALRDSGRSVRSASIYFAGSKKRVQIEIADSLIAETERAITRAREVLAAEAPPLPLVDSPKCSGCSMVAVCLPDEVNLLAERGERPSQIRVNRDEGAPLHVQEHGARVGLRGEQLVVRGVDGETTARLVHVSDVNLYGGAQISSQALRELMYREIPVSFFTTGGWYTGRAIGHESQNAELRRAQYRALDREDTRLVLARGTVASKIKNCRTMLRRNAEIDREVLRQLDELSKRAAGAASTAALLGYEGAAARAYFSVFAQMLKSDSRFDFERRNRRPPRDPVNALLSLAYALLIKNLVLAITKAGLDPLLGFYHETRAGRPALALDLMEEFRPIVADSAVVSAINTGAVSAEDFVRISDACALSSRGRKKFVAAYERRLDQEIEHPVFGYRCDYRRVLEIQARLLSRFLGGEIAAYPAFNTR